MARPRSTFQIAPKDRQQLQAWLRASTTRHSLAQRARIIWLSGQGQTVQQVAQKLDLTPWTVYKWRGRYAKAGVSGLYDRPRPGQPRKLSRKKAQQILHWTVHRIPRESTHWSIRLMAEYADVSPYQVRQVWKAADLKPHRLQTFKI